MDPFRNPFSPGAGSPPPELVGRDAILKQARILLGRVKVGRSEQSMLLTGLRGVGKTVLLSAIQREAKSAGYHDVFLEATEDKSLASLIIPPLRTLLFDMDRIASAGNKVKRGIAVLRSFIGAVKVTSHDMTFSLDIAPEKGVADSGDLEYDLPDLFTAIGEAALERQTAVAIFIDEVQYFNSKELGALIMAMHRMQQQQLPLALIGAGLPILPGLAGEAKSYAERLFSYPIIGPLSEPDAAKALQDPAHAASVEFSLDALDEVFHETQGYPYFVQEWGYQAWNIAERSTISRDDILAATEIATARLDKNFFRVRFDRLTPAEKKLLRAMAQLGHGPYRTGEVADVLKVGVNSLGPLRARLIKKGMIYSPAYGDLAFTVPLFDQFMLRAMPEF